MSGDGGRWGRELSDDDELTGTASGDWEGLELDTSASRSTGSDSAEDPLAYSGGRTVGDAFDGLGDSGGLPVPDLDMVAMRASAPPSEVSRAPSPGPARREVDPEPDHARVIAVADYGPAPSGILGAIPYTILVLTRRRALAAALTDLRRLAQAAARDHQEAQVELGRSLHAQRSAPALAVLEPHLAAADEAGRVAGERTQEWQRARETADAQRSSFDAKIAEAERAAAPYRDRETKLATQMDVRETDLRRAKARLTRVEIELRNVRGSPEADPSRAELLDAERLARRAEVDASQAKVDELAPKLAEARRELAAMLGEVNDLGAQRRSVDAVETRSEKVHISTASDAERGYHTSLSELATEALARGLAESAASDAARVALRTRAALQTRAREVKLHEAALSAYDPPAFKKGAIILASAAFVIVVTLLFVILR